MRWMNSKYLARYLFAEHLRCYFDSFDADSTLFSQTAKNEKTTKQTNAKGICCALCLTHVTDVASAIEVQAQHQHTLSNPGGIKFDIRLYAKAICHAEGPPISEFSWFSGYAWRIVACVQCRQHLGWSFQQVLSPDFYGLIYDRLIEMD